jgi:hypothetical protein
MLRYIAASLGTLRNAHLEHRCETALGGDVNIEQELQSGVAGIAHLLLQDAEHRLGDVAAGRADGDDRVGLRGDAAQRVDALLRAAAVVEVLDHQPGLGAVGQRQAAGLVDLLGGGLHRRLAVEAEDPDHAALGAEAVDLDRALLRGRAQRGEQRAREEGGKRKARTREG